MGAALCPATRPTLPTTPQSLQRLVESDETSIKIKKVWLYLYRGAADSQGNTLEFLWSSTPDAQATKRFFVKALRPCAGSASQACRMGEAESASSVPTELRVPQSAPRVINVEKKAASPKAIAELKGAGMLSESVELKLGQIPQYPDRARSSLHPTPRQRLVKPGLGFFSIETAWNTLQGYESMNMICKGQVHSVEKGNITDQIAFIASLFGVVA
ncbi:MAG: hypothetical protein NVSMB49_16560 [Ktedonobacteraceae bacterium]